MSRTRTLMLVGLAFLTLVFISAAAYAFFGSQLINRDDRTIEPLPLGEVPEALRISVSESGIVAIRADQLDKSYLPIDQISAESLYVTRDGEPVEVDGHV